tara:strand:- start:490 stop:741 length:252 start_codon:yes stop_codon:yes gene_type:complete
MSSELHKYIEDAVKKKNSLFDAEVLDFPKDNKIKVSKNFELNDNNYWKINDSANDDQLKAITGICLMFGFLLVMGLLANLNLI